MRPRLGQTNRSNGTTDHDGGALASIDRQRSLSIARSQTGFPVGWVFSAVLHGLLAWYLSDLILAPTEPLREPEPIVVQLMVVEPPTDVPESLSEPEEIAETEPEPEPLPEPEEVAEAEPEPEPLPEPEEVAEAEPEPEPLPEPEEVAEIEPEPEPLPEPEEVAEIEPESRSEPEEIAEIETESEPTGARVALAPAFESNAEEEAPPDRLDLIFAIKRQMRPCWRADPQAERLRDEFVRVDVRLNQDGSVRQARISDKQSLEAISGLRAMANQAHAAILDCGPFKLPSDRYAEWQTFTLRFHPRGIY